jgi:hypothetical protein
MDASKKFGHHLKEQKGAKHMRRASRTEPRLQPRFCVDFKPGLRNVGPEVQEKSAVKLRDF